MPKVDDDRPADGVESQPIESKTAVFHLPLTDGGGDGIDVHGGSGGSESEVSSGELLTDQNEIVVGMFRAVGIFPKDGFNFEITD